MLLIETVGIVVGLDGGGLGTKQILEVGYASLAYGGVFVGGAENVVELFEFGSETPVELCGSGNLRRQQECKEECGKWFHRWLILSQM